MVKHFTNTFSGWQSRDLNYCSLSHTNFESQRVIHHSAVLHTRLAWVFQLSFLTWKLLSPTNSVLRKFYFLVVSRLLCFLARRVVLFAFWIFHKLKRCHLRSSAHKTNAFGRSNHETMSKGKSSEKFYRLGGQHGFRQTWRWDASMHAGTVSSQMKVDVETIDDCTEELLDVLGGNSYKSANDWLYTIQQ